MLPKLTDILDLNSTFWWGKHYVPLLNFKLGEIPMDRTSVGVQCSLSWALLVRRGRWVDRSPVLWLWWQWRVFPIASWVYADPFHPEFCGGVTHWRILSGCCDCDNVACFEGIGWIVAMHCILTHQVSLVPVDDFHRLLLSHTYLDEVTSTWCLSAVLLQSRILGRKEFY